MSLITGARRTNLEYALGAAIAIAVAQEPEEALIGDDWRFFGDEVMVSTEDLLRRLTVEARGGFRGATR